jgi:hypothetical protein
MTVLSYTPDGDYILGNISYDFPSYSIGGGDYKFPINIDIFGEVASVPVEAGMQIYLEYMQCRVTLACTATITNISAFKSALSPLTLGSYVFESFGFKKSPAYWNYLNQETQPMISFSERDTIGDYPGNAAFPYGFEGVPIDAVNADTLYARCNGALPENSSLGIEYLVTRLLVPPGAYNKTSYSYFSP